MASGSIPVPIGQLFIPYGNAGSTGSTINIPGTAENYLLFSANSNSDASTLWFIRPNRSIAIKLAGGNAVTVTPGENRSFTISSNYNLGIFVAEIG